LMAIVHRSFQTGDTPWSSARLSQRLGIPPQTVEKLCSPLRAAGFLDWAGARPKLVPTKPAAMIKIRDLLRIIDESESLGAAKDKSLGTDQAVDELFVAMHEADEKTLGDRTIADLVKSS